MKNKYFISVSLGNETLEKEVVFGTVEAVKTVSDLFLPISGTILEVNKGLDGNPESVNSDPYGNGWMIRMSIGNAAELTDLLTAEQYKALIGH
jgi:glycine cleavage system H protein